MAKSKSFFGLRRGSTKSMTFSVFDGQQVTKDRVYEVKNPRSEGQMRQRMLMTTVGAAYKYLKAIADHSFEGKTAGMKCMQEFNSANLNLFKADANVNGAVAFNSYKDAEINPLAFILAKGSLSPITPSFNDENKLVAAWASTDADLATAEGIYALLGVKKDDLITFCTVVGEESTEGGVYSYKPTRFDICRLYCDQSGEVDSVEKAFTIATNSANAAVNIVATANGVTITSAVADFGCVIRSRKTDSSWLRSNATMLVRDGIGKASTAAQLATYPVGTDLILNNGQMESEQSGSAVSTAKIAPSLSFAKSVISHEGAGQVTSNTLSGVPDGATVTYESNNTTVATVDASTGVVTTKDVNGTATITATTSATSTYKSGSASYTVNNSESDSVSSGV